MHLRLSTVAAFLFLTHASTVWGKPESARIETIDGVTLHGSFYPTARRNPPTVLMLHALGEDSSKKGWTTLAEELSANGFAVLTFDFRGHGKSTEVAPALFWLNSTMNTSQYLKGRPGRDTIEFKDFNPSYYVSLINDIAAARAYLDRKNDSGACNTSNLIVIGAEDGATLGAGWINSEYYRFRTRQAMFAPLPMPDKRSEGQGLVCGVWLSMSPKLGGRDVSIPQTLNTAARVHDVPMVFIHSKGDELGSKFASYCEKNLKEKNKFTAAVGFEAGKLKGAELLQQGIAEQLRKYLENVVQERGNEWEQKDHRDAQYYWIFGPNPRIPGAWVPAKPMGEANLFYNTYTRFLALK